MADRVFTDAEIRVLVNRTLSAGITLEAMQTLGKSCSDAYYSDADARRALEMASELGQLDVGLRTQFRRAFG